MAHAKPKLFRDPIHDIIAIPPEKPESRLVLALIDTPEIQRLRRIRQLGLTHLVYHGAEHSRFSHSMGVLWIAMRMLNQLERRGIAIDPDERVVTLAAALLHDVGHGPFSHALEAVTRIDHEHQSIGIIMDAETGVGRVLADTDAALPERVRQRITHEGQGPQFLADVVSSQLDADRLDYILRDGHGTGIKIGIFDLERIIAMLDVDDGRLAVQSGGREAVEGYLLARFQMYKQVYLHRACRAAESMLKSALRRAGAARTAGVDLGYWPAGPLGDLLLGEPLGHAAFARLDDVDVWFAFKQWASCGDRALADLCSGIVRRRIWKILELPVGEPLAADEMIVSAREIAARRGYDPDHHVIVDECQDKLYKPFTGGEADPSIHIVEPGGRTYSIEARSDIIQMLLKLEHRQRLLCFHPDLRDDIAGLARDRFPNPTR